MRQGAELAPLRSAWVTNIPTPYRNHLYRVMADVFPSAALSFQVSYMSVSEPDRHWRFTPGDLPYPFRVWPGLHPRVRGVDLHFNPTMLRDLVRHPPDILVVGGWSSPTNVACSVLPRHVGLRVLWVESNLQSSSHRSPPADAFRRAVVSRYDAYVVPGARARQFVEHIDPEASSRPFLTLPNLVDESVWTSARHRTGRIERRRALGVGDREQLWVCPARLEPFKGLHLFLPCTAGLKGVRLLVAGEGSQRAELERRAAAERWPVTFLGQVDQAGMVDLYSAADLFVLPSLSDASPLSPIEAAAAGLPLLVSTRIGNVDDVLEEGVNGWSLDPDDAERTRELLARIVATPPSRLLEMGRRSIDRFEERFQSRRCVERLAGGLREAWEGRDRAPRD